MSTQRSLYKDFSNMRPKQVTLNNQISDQSLQSEHSLDQRLNILDKKSKINISSITPMSDAKFNKLANNIQSLPEMPESAKNIAKHYLDAKLPGGSLDPIKIPAILSKEERRYDNLGNKLLSGIKQIGLQNQNQNGMATQASRNVQGQGLIGSSANTFDDQNSNSKPHLNLLAVGKGQMNKSFSVKSLTNNLQMKNAERSTILDESELAPQISARIKEVTDEHISKRSSSKNVLWTGGHNSNQEANMAQTYQPNLGGSMQIKSKNLSMLKNFNKNIIITTSQSSVALPSNKLSPLPERYHQHLPELLQKKVVDGASTSFNFNPSKLQTKKGSLDLRSLELLQNHLRQDVSYLGELKNKDQALQPTILTTGNKAQDELLETTLGMKYMGKSLLNLPQTLEELSQILDSVESQKKHLGTHSFLSKRTKEENHLDRYLAENLGTLDTIQESGQDDNFELPGVSLQQFKQIYSGPSKFLSNQQTNLQQKNFQSPQSSQITPFNLAEKTQQQFFNKSSSQLESYSKKDKNTYDNLALLDNNLVKKYANDAFFNQKQTETQDALKSKHELIKQQQMLKQDKSLSYMEGQNFHNRTLTTLKQQKKLKSQTNKNIEQIIREHAGGDNLHETSLTRGLERSLERSNNKTLIEGERNSSLSPINIKTHKQLSNNTLVTQIIQSKATGNYGNPSSRQDALLLIVWFEKMLQLVQQQTSQDSMQQSKNDKVASLSQNQQTINSDSVNQNNKFQLLQVIMNICVKELARQVSVQCIERGLILQRVFQSYARLIELINEDSKTKRWNMKRELTDKLDKYITIQESQIKGYRDKIAEMEAKEESLKLDLKDCLTRLNSSNVLISKFKKKCWNAQKDYEGSTRQLKFLEKENQMLKTRIQELSEKIGDDQSDIDDNDRKRMMLQIDEEMYLDKVKSQLPKTNRDGDYGDTLEDQLDVDQIPDRDIIKEEDKGTDMLDFEKYLRDINGWKYNDNTTQTEKIIRKHVKLGVKPEKLGIVRDKETFIDPRMFYSENQQTQQMRIGGTAMVDQSMAFLMEQEEQNLQEDDSDQQLFSSDEEDELRMRRQESSVDNDETIKELGMLMLNGANREGFISIDGEQNNKRNASVQGDFTLEDLDAQDQDLSKLNEYGTSKVHQIISVSPLKNLKLKTDQQFYINQKGRIKPNNQIKGGDATSIRAFEEQVDEGKGGGTLMDLLTGKVQGKGKRSVMQIFAERIRARLKDLISSEQLDRIKQEDEEFANKLVSELKNTQVEVKEMNKEIQKKDRQVRFSLKLNVKNEKDLKQAESMIDQLEMENYQIRELLNEIVKYFEDYEGLIAELVKQLEGRDSMGQLSINDLKNKLLALSEKIALVKKKSIQQLNEDDVTQGQVASNNLYTTTNALDNMSAIEDQFTDEAISSYNQTATNFNKRSVVQGEQKRQIQSRGRQQVGRNPTSMGVNVSTDARQASENMRKKATTRFQMFNIGKRRKPNKSKTTHPSTLILRKLQSKKNITDVMPKKMLLRTIYQIYQEHGPFDLSNQQNSQPQNQAISIVNQNSTVQNQMNNNTSTFNVSSAINTVQAQASLERNTVTNVQQAVNTASSFNPVNNNRVPLSVWVYESFMQKYGLKNVAEKKFQQLIGSCIVHKESSPRIRLFGRFFEIYNDLTQSDFNRYLEIVEMFSQQILNFKVDDDLETILLPISRAVDFYRLKFEQRFAPLIFAKRIYLIEKMKVPVSPEEQRNFKHLKSVREAIDLDWFLEYLIDTFTFLQEERDNQIRDIFLAADVIFNFIKLFQLDGDGLLNENEFVILMKVFHYKKEQEIFKLFQDFASIQPDQANTDQRNTLYLNLEQFTSLCVDKEYFTVKVVSNFIKTKVNYFPHQMKQNVEEDYKQLVAELPRTMSMFKERLREINLLTAKEWVVLLENFEISIKESFSNRVGWLTFRIIDETLKRTFLKMMSEKFMPIDLKQTGISLKPQPSLFNQLAVNLFDTLQ